MSLFSERLKTLLQDSGQTIYKISKLAGVDRTTVQRAMIGERLPSVSFVETLCEYLRVSPLEKTELMEYYTISKIGETNYETRKHIKSLVEQIAHLHGASRQPSEIYYTVAMEAETRPVSVYNGEYQVNSFIQKFLEHAAISRTAICISVPFEYRYFFDCLRQFYWDSNGEWRIAHLMKLVKNHDIPLHATTNLDALSNVFPFSFCLQNGYRPSYFYQSAPLSQDISLVMPYYLFTQDCLITLASDFQTAILYRDPCIISIYKTFFDARQAEALPLITNISNSTDMASTYTDAWQQAGHITHVIEPQPCFARYYTKDMLERHLRKEIEDRDTIKKSAWLVFQQMQSASEPTKSYFTVDGLRYLVQTGVMADLPPQYATPFSLEEREQLLMAMRSEIASDVILYRALNPAKFMASTAATIQIYKDRRVMFLSIGEGYIVSSLLHEKSIGDAFFDFFESLPDSGLLYSKENTLQLVDDCLKEIFIQKDAVNT